MLIILENPGDGSPTSLLFLQLLAIISKIIVGTYLTIKFAQLFL